MRVVSSFSRLDAQWWSYQVPETSAANVSISPPYRRIAVGIGGIEFNSLGISIRLAVACRSSWWSSFKCQGDQESSKDFKRTLPLPRSSSVQIASNIFKAFVSGQRKSCATCSCPAPPPQSCAGVLPHLFLAYRLAPFASKNCAVLG